jgi:pSer/pThr/pTyr-binding forkhead associated (FHA) protein
MMHLELNGQRYAIAAGEMVVGSSPEAGLPLRGDRVRPRHLVLRALADGTVAVRRGDPEAEALINGVRLGDDPTVLLHGDKIQVGGYEVLAVEEERAGNTRTSDASLLAGVGAAPRAGARVYGTANGRLVCLTDGREYQVGAELVFGRDAASDVVVTGGDVSRQHALIRATPAGYELSDLSANGTALNGALIGGPTLLARADVIRIGADEFRFYADQPRAASDDLPVGPPPGAEHRLGDTLIGIPASKLVPQEVLAAARPARAERPLASLLVRSGRHKGERLAVRSPVVNIGRADYNDLVVDEPSVSAAHAKLQRRESVWVVSDLGSTNGTTVDGEPVEDEFPLGPGATIRLGEVALLFEPLEEAGEGPAGRAPGRAAERTLPRSPAVAVPEPTAEAAEARPEVIERVPTPRTVPATSDRGVSPLLVAGVLLIVAGIVAFLLMQQQ